MKSDDVTCFGTDRERKLAVESMLKDHIDEDLAKNITRKEDDLLFCTNELRLAREIYKLKNIGINAVL